jgi:hypothetical protein
MNIASRSQQHKADEGYDRVFFLQVPESQLLEVESRFIKALERN